MPRGKFTNHKGRARRFTSPEELEEQSKQDQFKERHTKKAADSDAESEEGENSEGSDSESENEGKGKGVEKLIEVENPNRIQKKAKKLSSLNQVTTEAGKPELSRREREELEKQRAYMHYTKLHAEGKTEEARADLARLAIIKKQREEAAAKREAEKQAKEAAKQAKTAQTLKAIGKKT